MAALSEKDRDRLKKSTHAAGIALAEDISYFRKVLDMPDPNSGELRRLTGSLRRLLIDRDIASIASPRIGRIFFEVNDTSKAVAGLQEGQDGFYVNGGAPTYFGMNAKHFVMARSEVAKNINEEDLGKIIRVDLDGFLSQKILFFQGVWLPRRSVIRYIAYIGSGVHSGKPETKKDKEYAPTIESLRKTFVYTKETIMVDSGPLFKGLPTNGFKFGSDAVDVALMELLATLQLITTSSDVIRLEEIIRTE
jgi:hypothetical protein